MKNTTVLAQGLRDIKSPVSFPPNYLLLAVILILLAVAALFFLIRFLISNRKKRPVPAIAKPAHVAAYEALEALRKKELPQRGRIKEYYYELSDIVRHYIEKRFNVRAPEMTTEEFLYALGSSDDLLKEHRDALNGFLHHCDLVKYAKYGPTLVEIDDAFGAAKELIDQTKVLTQENTVYAQ